MSSRARAALMILTARAFSAGFEPAEESKACL